MLTTLLATSDGGVNVSLTGDALVIIAVVIIVLALAWVFLRRH